MSLDTRQASACAAADALIDVQELNLRGLLQYLVVHDPAVYEAVAEHLREREVFVECVLMSYGPRVVCRLGEEW